MYQVAGLVALVLGFVLGGMAYGAVGGGFWGWVAGFAAFVATGWGIFIVGGLVFGAMSKDRDRQRGEPGGNDNRVRPARVSDNQHSDSAGELREFVQESLREEEEVVLIARGGVVAAELDVSTGQGTPIDQFKPWEGWLAVTDNDRAIYGRFGRGGRPELSSVLPFTTWDPDPRGLVFRNGDADPEGMLVFQPQSITPTVLHSTLSESLTNSTQVRQLQGLYANRVAFGATLEQDYAEINRVYGMLRDLGADADQLLVDEEKAKLVGVMPVFEVYEPHLDPEGFDSWRSDRSE